MKVLFLTDGVYPFSIGGMQKHSLLLAAHLAEAGIQLDVVHCGGKGYSGNAFRSGFSNKANENLHEIFVEFPKFRKIPGHYIRENREYSKRIYNKVAAQLQQYDLIYAQGFTGYYFIKKKKQGVHRLPVFVNLHGFEMFQFAPDFKVRLQYVLLKKEARYHLHHADFIYSFGGKIDDILYAENVPETKVLRQSNGIDKDWLTDEIRKHNVRSFVFIGRNERRKGVFELTEAIRLFCSHYENSAGFVFHFIGPIEEQSQVKDKRVIYHGELRNAADIRTVLDDCDCLVCPSYAEGMPTVILEAMARGLAIIGTNVGAVSRMIHHNGILLEKPGTKELKEAIISMIDLPDNELREMKKKSLCLVKDQFLWPEVAKAKIAGFKKVIAGD